MNVKATVYQFSDTIPDLWKASSDYTNVSSEVDPWPLRKAGAVVSSAQNSLVQEAITGALLSFYRSTSQWDWKIKIGAGLLLLTLATYLTTSLESWIVIQSKKKEKRPPTVPYWIPFVRNLIPFLWDPARFFHRATMKFGHSVPVHVGLGPVGIYLVSGADHFTSLFKATRCMSTKSGVLLALENMFGTPSDVIPFYAADDSGANILPLPGSKVKPEHRINYHQVRAAHKHLSGPGLTHMIEHFLGVIRRQIHDSQIGSEWVEMPDLFAYLQNSVFCAAVEAMCGSHLLSQYPKFVEDFWEFDRSVPTLFLGLPRWLTPKPYKVRERLLEAVRRWHRLAHENSDCTKTGADDAEWEPYFGSKLIRERQKYCLDLEFMNTDALAAEDLGLIFATNTNAIPAVGWFILEIYRDPCLLPRVRREVDDARVPSPEMGKPEFDVNKLVSGPLLQSIYAETLRLRVAIMVTRTPEREDFHLGEWVFPKDKIIALSSRTAAMNPNLWNIGSPEDPHPLDQFWAERFLVYPDDPTSGPLRKDLFTEGATPRGSIPPNRSETAPKFTLDGVAGGWIPYGGGQRICPGRHFAKQEIIATFAMLFTHYDIELLTPKDFRPTPNMNYFPFGGLPPVEKIPFRMRKRN